MEEEFCCAVAVATACFRIIGIAKAFLTALEDPITNEYSLHKFSHIRGGIKTWLHLCSEVSLRLTKTRGSLVCFKSTKGIILKNLHINLTATFLCNL